MLLPPDPESNCSENLCLASARPDPGPGLAAVRRSQQKTEEENQPGMKFTNWLNFSEPLKATMRHNVPHCSIVLKSNVQPFNCLHCGAPSLGPGRIPIPLSHKVNSDSVLKCPYRLACRNFGKANRLAHVKILVLFTIKVVDIII